MGTQRADLVLEGGGVKGIALVGAITVLAERGYEVNRIAGTSAGAIVGALVAAGYGADELTEIMRSVDYSKFRDGSFIDRLGIVGQAVSVLFEQGVYKGEYLERWLAELLSARQKHVFGDLKLPDPGSSIPPDRQYRLVVMTSDLSNGLLRELPWDYPAFGLDAAAATITSAVRASMSIPFFYAPVKIKDGHGDDCWFVDGGLLSNFPVTVFDRTDGKPPRWPTFGIKLSARPTANQGVAHHIHGTLSLGEAMITTMTGFYDRMHIDDPSVQDRTIFIDTMNVRATDFDIGPKTQQKLYENGRRAAEMFLDGTSHTPGWNWDDYIAKYGGRAPVVAPPTTTS